MDIVAYMIIATIGSGVDMYGMIFGFVGIVSACLALPVAPVIAVAAAITAMVVFTKLVIMWIEDYQETVDLYFRALDGDIDAANKLNGKAFLATVSMFFDFATGGFNGSKGAGPDDIPTPNGRKTSLSGKGYADDVVDDIFKMKNVDSCSDDLLESIAKSGKSADVADTLSKYSDDVIEALNKSTDKDTVVSLIAKHGDDAVQISAKSSPEALKAISGLSDDAAESFFKTAGKHGDELASAINKSANINDAVSFVSKYTDDGAEIFLRHGDDAIVAVKGCDAPYKAVQIIKNGGLQYGDEAVQALKKSGDKAVEALTKVPTKDCAELIAKYGDDAATVFAEYGDNAVAAVKKCKTTQEDALLSIFVYGDDAADVIAKHGDAATNIIIDYSDNGLTALKNGITPNQIDELESFGITPNDYNKTGCIRNLEVHSVDEAQAIIDSNHKIHTSFSQVEIDNLKDSVVKMEAEFKSSGMSGNDVGPAICGVYNKKTGEITYSVNSRNGISAPDANNGTYVSQIDDRIADMSDEIKNAHSEKNGGIGSHAEVYAVRDALLSCEDADPDDLLIFVNYTQQSVNKEAAYIPFYTCPHCAYILDGFNILSNVEF